MTFSCTEATQSFISHFNQYSLVDPSWDNRELAIDLERYGAEFDTTVILETEFHENNNISISHPDKHKRNWKIVSTINVTYAPIQINWARNIASNYFSQQQPASSFTTVSNVWFFSVNYVINSSVQPFLGGSPALFLLKFGQLI